MYLKLILLDLAKNKRMGVDIGKKLLFSHV